MRNVHKSPLFWIVLACLIFIITMLGCQRQSTRVGYNISKEADNFNVTRRLAVINARSDVPLFELIGNFSLKNNTTNELEIICEVERGVYRKHFVYLNQWTTYVVEDLSGAYVNKYHYEVNFLPQMIKPITFTFND